MKQKEHLSQQYLFSGSTLRFGKGNESDSISKTSMLKGWKIGLLLTTSISPLHFGQNISTDSI